MTGIRNVPSGLERNLALHLQGVKSTLDELTQGDQRVVRYDELQALLKGTTITTKGSSDSTTTEDPVEPRPPSAPEELTAAGGLQQIALQWSSGFNETYLGTEIWGKRTVEAWSATENYPKGKLVLSGGVIYISLKKDNLNHPVTDAAWWAATTYADMADRVQLDTTASTYYTFLAYEGTTLVGETWYFWVRNVDENGLTSEFFPPDDTGIPGTATAVQVNPAPLEASVPTGGTTGQVLAKVSNADYDVDWADDQTIPPATGWADATGTLDRTALATYAGQTVSNPPTQAEMQAIDDHLKKVSQVLGALITDLTASGLLTP